MIRKEARSRVPIHELIARRWSPSALGLVDHPMGGFDADALRRALGVPAAFVPMAVIAIGYQGNIGHLHAEFHATETGLRRRDEPGAHFFLGRWGTPIA